MITISKNEAMKILSEAGYSVTYEQMPVITIPEGKDSRKFFKETWEFLSSKGYHASFGVRGA